ncbi:MAG: rubredoxin [Thermoleophilia bacterium]
MQYKCSVCGYVYDEENEDAVFDELSDDWACLTCGAPKDSFELVE